MSIKVSFILPVYNVEKYLKRCMESLYSQGLDTGEYEIVLVNDGSTDRSLDICNQYAKSDPSIVLINQENQGVASARNKGISQAKGKYLCFVDPDDYLNPGGIGYLLHNFNLEGYSLIRYWMKIIDSDDCDDKMLGDVRINFSGSAYDFLQEFDMDSFCVTYLYDRLWLLDTGIRFSDFKIAEDYLFISKLLMGNPSMVSTTARIYAYVKNDASVTCVRSKDHSRRCVESYMGVFRELKDFMDNCDLDDNIPQIVNISIQDKMRSFLSRVLTSDIGVKEFRAVVSDLKAMKIIPVHNKKASVGGNVFNSVYNSLCFCPILLPPFRLLYTKLVVPWILPRISKN